MGWNGQGQWIPGDTGGGTQGTGGNPNGGQPGSAAEPGSFGSKLGGQAISTGASLLGMGPVGTAFGLLGRAAQEGWLGPNFGNISLEAMARDPGAYGTGPTGNGFGTGANQGNTGTAIGDEHDNSKAAATGTSLDGGYSGGTTGGSGLGGGDSGGGSTAGSGRGSGTGSGTGEGGSERGGDEALGGIIKGKGGPRQDNIKANVSVGEAVVNQPATKAVGTRFIRKHNKIGNTPESPGAKRQQAKRLVSGKLTVR